MPCLRFNKHSQRLGSQIQHVLACYSTGLTALHFEGLTKMKKKNVCGKRDAFHAELNILKY